MDKNSSTAPLSLVYPLPLSIYVFIPYMLFWSECYLSMGGYFFLYTGYFGIDMEMVL